MLRILAPVEPFWSTMPLAATVSTNRRSMITGLWQVSGRRSIDMRGMLELDVEYVDNQSFILDLKLLSRTPKAVLEAQGAA